MPLFTVAGLCYGLGCALIMPFALACGLSYAFVAFLCSTVLAAMLGASVYGSYAQEGAQPEKKRIRDAFDLGLLLSVLPAVGLYALFGYALMRITGFDPTQHNVMYEVMAIAATVVLARPLVWFGIWLDYVHMPRRRAARLS